MHNWKRRWFMMTDKTISYSADETTQDIIETIPLSQVLHATLSLFCSAKRRTRLESYHFRADACRFDFVQLFLEHFPELSLRCLQFKCFHFHIMLIIFLSFPNPPRSIQRPNNTQVSRLQEETGADGSSVRENTFYVITPERRFAFSADSRDDKHEWMQLIDECRGLWIVFFDCCKVYARLVFLAVFAWQRSVFWT